MTVSRALIVDETGTVLGKVTFGPSNEVDVFDAGASPLGGTPISAGAGRGVGSMPASPRAAREFGAGQQSHPAPQRRLGGPHEHSEHSGHRRYLSPERREHQRTEERPHEKHGPLFRGKYQPRGAADPAKPEHMTTGDVQSAVKGGYSGLSREKYDKMFAGTKLSGQYDTVVKTARDNGISPALMAAIMAHESARGQSTMISDAQ